MRLWRVVVVGGMFVLLTAGCRITIDPSGGSEEESRAGESVAPSSSRSADPNRSGSAQPSRAASSATTPSTVEAAQARIRQAAVRLQVASCDGTSQGSGFVLTDELVVTVAHVVEDTAVIRVIHGTTSRAGRIIGMDRRADVALVQVSTPFQTEHLRFATQPPDVGDEVGVLSYPAGDPLSFSRGVVTGTGRKRVIGGISRSGLIETDARTAGGSSGGPVFNSKGRVVGLVDSGPEWDPEQTVAVSSATAAPLVAKWREAGDLEELQQCSSLVPTETQDAPETNYSSAEVQAALTIDLYFKSINRGDYPTALAQLVNGEKVDLEKFSEATSTSQDSDIQIRAVTSEDDRPVVWVTFISEQAKGAGPSERPEETCTRWSLDYEFEKHNGLWLIDGSEPHDGAGNESC